MSNCFESTNSLNNKKSKLPNRHIHFMLMFFIKLSRKSSIKIFSILTIKSNFLDIIFLLNPIKKLKRFTNLSTNSETLESYSISMLMKFLLQMAQSGRHSNLTT